MSSTSRNRPKVVVLGSSLIMPLLESQYSNRFHFLKTSESQLPLHQYLTSCAESVQAVLIDSGCRLLTSSVLDFLPSLKIVVNSGTGLDHLDLEELKRRGVAIAYAGNIFSEDVADMAVGLLIDVLRRISAADRDVRRGVCGTLPDFPLGLKVKEFLINYY